MTSWLFTQVWLWSFAAFVLGVLVNYALFVRPLQKRLRAREEDLVRLEDELATEPPQEGRLLDILGEHDDGDQEGARSAPVGAAEDERAVGVGEYPTDESRTRPQVRPPHTAASPAGAASPQHTAASPADTAATEDDLNAGGARGSGRTAVPGAAPATADVPIADGSGAARDGAAGEGAVGEAAAWDGAAWDGGVAAHGGDARDAAAGSAAAREAGADPHAFTEGFAPVERPGHSEPAWRAEQTSETEQDEGDVPAGPLSARPYTFNELPTRQPRPGPAAARRDQPSAHPAPEDRAAPGAPGHAAAGPAATASGSAESGSAGTGGAGPELGAAHRSADSDAGEATTPRADFLGGATREVPVDPELPIRFSATPPDHNAAPFEAPEQEDGGNTWFRKPALDEEATADSAAEAVQPQSGHPEPAQPQPAQQETAQQEAGSSTDEGSAEEAARAAAATASRWRRRGSVSVRGSLAGEDGAEQPEQGNGDPAGEGADAVPPAVDGAESEQTGPAAASGDAAAESDSADGEAALPRRTPGAAARPGPDGEILAGSVGPLIKGHAASRQYHTPESPQYDMIVADVWFRTTEDAETAGFHRWDG